MYANSGWYDGGAVLDDVDTVDLVLRGDAQHTERLDAVHQQQSRRRSTETVTTALPMIWTLSWVSPPP